jgi:hypothetical protein
MPLTCPGANRVFVWNGHYSRVFLIEYKPHTATRRVMMLEPLTPLRAVPHLKHPQLYHDSLGTS